MYWFNHGRTHSISRYWGWFYRWQKWSTRSCGRRFCSLGRSTKGSNSFFGAVQSRHRQKVTDWSIRRSSRLSNPWRLSIHCWLRWVCFYQSIERKVFFNVQSKTGRNCNCLGRDHSQSTPRGQDPCHQDASPFDGRGTNWMFNEGLIFISPLGGGSRGRMLILTSEKSSSFPH